jgi:putative tricarboxylic transport membrane protein
MQVESPRADRITAVVLFVLGVAMLIGGYTMDRLEIRQIHPASIPGLVPMILGAVLALCAGLLYAGAGSAAAEAPPEAGAVSWSDLWVTLALALGFALVLVGRLPFFWAAAIFIAAFVGWFSWREAATPTARLRAGAWAVGFALLASGAISGLFRYGFLVRLP